MPSIPSLGRWQVKNGRLFLTTTEAPPSSDWRSKQEIQAVAATIQRLFRRQQNRTQSDQCVEQRFLLPRYCLQKFEERHDLYFQRDVPPPSKPARVSCCC